MGLDFSTHTFYLKKEKQEREGDWQTNPDFDREEGGWKPEDVASSFRNALTISNAIKKGKSNLLTSFPM